MFLSSATWFFPEADERKRGLQHIPESKNKDQTIHSLPKRGTKYFQHASGEINSSLLFRIFPPYERLFPV